MSSEFTPKVNYRINDTNRSKMNTYDSMQNVLRSFSLYLYGGAGVGKSSFVLLLCEALDYVITKYVMSLTVLGCFCILCCV